MLRYSTRHPAEPLINETLHRAEIASAGLPSAVLTSSNLPTAEPLVDVTTGLSLEEFIWGADEWGATDVVWTQRD